MAFGPFTQQPNIIILMTDQQRAFRYFPETWIDQNLPNFRKLQANGLTFNNAICNASRCSPSRSVLYTGQYTWQTFVYSVGGVLTPGHNTIGSLMRAAGYQMIYKGKWHLSGGTEPFDRPVDPNALADAVTNMEKNYEIEGWNPPDAGVAGANNFTALKGSQRNEPKSVPTSGPQQDSPYFSLGGSLIDNDDRYVIGPNATDEQESAIDFLNAYQASGSTEPFCLAVSLVNPHDINVFPNFVASMQYINDRSVWQSYTDFELPPSYSADSLLDKPTVQRQFVFDTDKTEPFSADFTQLEYLQFYAYLQTLPDQLFDQLMGVMSEDLINNTIIIRLADHGELGMSHCGMRFKDLNAYQEAINVPLVFSNPLLFPEAQTTDQPVGLIDLMPTLASIVGLSPSQKEAFGFKGKDISKALLNPSQSLQSAVLFCYDDMVAAGEVGHIRTFMRHDYKFSVYFSMDAELVSGEAPTANVIPSSFQYELYDLVNDPDEINNLLPVGRLASADAVKLQIRFYKDLTDKMSKAGITPNGWPATLPDSN